MIQPQPTYNGKFMFQKIFTELDYLASGILQIPAGTEKPSKPAKDNSYVRSSLPVREAYATDFRLCTGFLLHRRRCFGRGASYSFCDRTVRFFCSVTTRMSLTRPLFVQRCNVLCSKRSVVPPHSPCDVY